MRVRLGWAYLIMRHRKQRKDEIKDSAIRRFFPSFLLQDRDAHNILKETQRARGSVSVFLERHICRIGRCLILSMCVDTTQQTPTTDEYVWWRPQFEHFEADWEHFAFNITLNHNSGHNRSSMNTGSCVWTVDADQGCSRRRRAKKEMRIYLIKTSSSLLCYLYFVYIFLCVVFTDTSHIIMWVLCFSNGHFVLLFKVLS